MQNNDLISRSALLEAMPKEDFLLSSLVRKCVVNAPAVDAAPVRHGRWNIEWKTTIDYCTGEYEEEPTAICPFCDHRDYGSAYDDSYWGRPWNYCPNCGAKMDAEVEG